MVEIAKKWAEMPYFYCVWSLKSEQKLEKRLSEKKNMRMDKSKIIGLYTHIYGHTNIDTFACIYIIFYLSQIVLFDIKLKSI